MNNDKPILFSDVEREEGIEGIVGLWLHGPYQNREQALDFVMLRTGYSEVELRKAYNGINSFNYSLHDKKPLSRRLTLQTAKLLHYVGNDFFVGLDIGPWLLECAVAGYEMTDERRKNFSLHQLETTGLSARSYAQIYGDEAVEVEKGVFKTFNFFLDAPAAIGLFYRDEPRAVVSVFPEDETTLQIKQIQGARVVTEEKERKTELVFRKSSRGGGCLGTLDWKKFLVRCAEKVGKDLGYSIMSIQGARNNRWVLDGGLPLERGLQIYDATAERLGYAQVGIGNWYKAI